MLQKDSLWSRWVDVAFGKLDSNGDGYIDLDELINRLPMLTGTDNPEAERVLAVSCSLSAHLFQRNQMAASAEPTNVLGRGSSCQSAVLLASSPDALQA